MGSVATHVMRDPLLAGPVLLRHPMPSLPETLNSDVKKNQVVDDCCAVIDAEVDDKGGLSGFAIKAGYAVVKGVKPGFVKHVVHDLLPEFSAALDPIFQEAKTKGAPVSAHFNANASRVADALLAITDARAKRASGPVSQGSVPDGSPSSARRLPPRWALTAKRKAGGVAATHASTRSTVACR